MGGQYIFYRPHPHQTFFVWGVWSIYFLFYTRSVKNKSDLIIETSKLEDLDFLVISEGGYKSLYITEMLYLLAFQT